MEACNLVTAGKKFAADKVFTEYLNDEIKSEKKNQKHKSLPKMSGGWEQDIRGTKAKLTRKVAGETISVSFSVNNSIPPEEPLDEPCEDKPEPISTPNFVVEVSNKDTKQTLTLECYYLINEISNSRDGDSNTFTIRKVSFQPSGDSEWQENYSLTIDSQSSELCDHLKNFLTVRGVDNTFALELVNLATALEHKEYIRFLEELRLFVK